MAKCPWAVSKEQFQGTMMTGTCGVVWIEA